MVLSASYERPISGFYLLLPDLLHSSHHQLFIPCASPAICWQITHDGLPGEISQAQLDSAISGTSANTNTNNVSTLDSSFCRPRLRRDPQRGECADQCDEEIEELLVHPPHKNGCTRFCERLFERYNYLIVVWVEALDDLDINAWG